MRFKARGDKTSVSFLASLLSPLSRLSETSYLKLDVSVLRMSSGPQSASSSSCFCEVSLSSLFSAYKIESCDGNQILVECDLDHLRSLLSSVVSAMTPYCNCLIKLAKRNSYPVLVVEKDSDGSSSSIDVKGEVPIRVLQVDEFAAMLPPKTSTPDVQLYLPPPSNPVLRNALDKMRTMAQFLYLHGTMGGELSLSTMTDCVCAKVFFDGLKVEFTDCKASGAYRAKAANSTAPLEDDTEAKATLKVDAKKLTEMFRWQIPLTKWVTDATLCMVQDEMLILHCRLPLGDPSEDPVGFITMYTPAAQLDPDEIA